jgi:hypothetical protein
MVVYNIWLAQKDEFNPKILSKSKNNQIFVVCFFEFLTPSTLGGYNFLNSTPFSTIFSAPNAPIGGV